jgi:glycosyltransferase involved in cell wall biosynthesis
MRRSGRRGVRILFVHRFFPGQFVHTARALAADPDNRVVFLHAEGHGAIAGVEGIRFAANIAGSPATHHYLQSLESAVRLGQAAYRACRQLARRGFQPDVICAHAGFGPGLYIKDAFPAPPLLGYFEWYYHADGADAGFLDASEVNEDDRLRIRTRNAGILLELASSDRAICPTRFQKRQFPAPIGDKLTLLHDGVDTARFRRRPEARGELAALLRLPEDVEILTYASRGLEPYRGFPSFMAALSLLQSARPKLHAVIAGDDHVYYGKRLPDNGSFVALVRKTLPALDWQRIHLTGYLSSQDYLRVLQASDAHVYLTVPFVLSWSLFEAMSTGCAVIGSATEPVEEVIRHGETGLLADLRSPEDIAAKISEILDDPSVRTALGVGARRLIEDRFALAKLLPAHLGLLRRMAQGEHAREPASYSPGLRST